MGIDIYYTQEEVWANGLCDDEPEPLLTSEYYKNLPFDTYRKCYANLEYFKNVFVMKSPFKFEMKLVNGNIQMEGNEELVEPRFVNEGIIQFLFGTTFFSDSDVEMSIIPASLHDNSFTRNTRLLSGTMNISKWFRPILPAILWTNDFNVDNDDALFYIKFHTEEKINLKKFKMNDELHTYRNDCIHLKDRKPKLNFKKIYNIFTNKKYSDKIMKEIKNNLVE